MNSIISPVFFMMDDPRPRFPFFALPQVFFGDPTYSGMSSDAKILYALLLNRTTLSQKNGLHDACGRVFIYYTINQVRNDLGCGHDKAPHVLKELEETFGLIERKKQGLCKPDKIFVKVFMPARSAASAPGEAVPPSPGPAPEIANPDLQAAANQESGLPDIRCPDVRKAAANNTDSSQTQLNNLHPSTNATGWANRCEELHKIKENVGYRKLCQEFDSANVDELLELLADIACSSKKAERVNGELIPMSEIQDRFSMLDYQHLHYVLERLAKNDKPIQNVRAYLVSTLFNASLTMNHYYQADENANIASFK